MVVANGTVVANRTPFRACALAVLGCLAMGKDVDEGWRRALPCPG